MFLNPNRGDFQDGNYHIDEKLFFGKSLEWELNFENEVSLGT